MRSYFIGEGSFIAGLDRKDLMRLRQITREKLGGVRLTDEQCDIIIEEAGLEAAVDTVKYAVDGSLID